MKTSREDRDRTSFLKKVFTTWWSVPANMKMKTCKDLTTAALLFNLDSLQDPKWTKLHGFVTLNTLIPSKIKVSDNQNQRKRAAHSSNFRVHQTIILKQLMNPIQALIPIQLLTKTLPTDAKAQNSSPLTEGPKR